MDESLGAAEHRAATFDGLYRDSYPRMMTIALATVRDPEVAADAVQDAYAALWSQWQSIRTPMAWLRRAVISNRMDAMRTSRRRTPSCGVNHHRIRSGLRRRTTSWRCWAD